MRTKAASLYQLSFYIMCLANYVFSKPSKYFSKGFSGKHLPPGGWTHWFNIDHPGGGGDFETYDRIVRVYGRTCLGIPCRKPIAVKVVSDYGLRPEETGDQVRISPRRGISCFSSRQHGENCANYKVRFYCRNLHLKCSRSKFYPQHWDQSRTRSSNTTTNDTLTYMQHKLYDKKMKQLEKKLKRKAQSQDGLGKDKERNDILKLRKKRRRNRKKSTKKRTVPPERNERAPSGVVAVLAYHPRHPRV